MMAMTTSSSSSVNAGRERWLMANLRTADLGSSFRRSPDTASSFPVPVDAQGRGFGAEAVVAHGKRRWPTGAPLDRPVVTPARLLLLPHLPVGHGQEEPARAVAAVD